MKLGVITGMQAEARILNGVDCVAESGGGQAGSTRRKVDDLIAHGARGIVSFGIAGGLDPSLRSGDLVLATSVHTSAAEPLPVDAPWLQILSETLPEARRGALYCASRIISSAEDKRLIFQQTKAFAADMESHIAIAAAARHGLPFAAIRAIADTATDDLPPAVQHGLDENGKAAIGPVLRSLLLNPTQLPALIRVARQSRRALNALLGCRGALLLLQV